MTRSVLAGFIVNLLQDVNVLRPLIYLSSDDLELKPLIFITQAFLKRDKQEIWINQLQRIAKDTNACIHIIKSSIEVWKMLNEANQGFLISASESNLNAHKETHEIFRYCPAGIKTITLQHGFECVGFLMNKNHQKAYGYSVGFAADYICGWMPLGLQRNLRPLQRSRYINAGPAAWINKTSKRKLTSSSQSHYKTIGIVCENLHSVRHGVQSSVNLFMEQFFELAAYLRSIGREIALRPHPGGQYTLKNKIDLPDNVILENRPSYEVAWSNYSYGISAPSSVLFDLIINNVPAMVWQDTQQIIDITQVAYLPVAQTADDMISFANIPYNSSLANSNQQLSSILRSPDEVRKNFIELLTRITEFNPSRPCEIETISSNQKRIRILLLASSMLPTLVISFIKPFSLLQDKVEYRLLHGIGLEIQGGGSQKAAVYKKCEELIDDFNPDLVIMCRYSGRDGLILAKICQQKRIPIMYHIDDLLFEPSAEVLDQKKFDVYKKRSPTILNLIQSSDVLYSSTPALMRELKAATRHHNIVVGKIYKSVDPNDILVNEKREKVIGYTGFGHSQDIETIEDVLIEILNTYSDWKLELIGTIKPSKKLRSLGGQVAIIPPEKDYDSFISLLKSRKWSIGICPLVDNRFNSFKANTKWVEYSFCNIATIASNSPVYSHGISTSSICRCNSQQEWRDSFIELMESPEKLDQIVLSAQEEISQNFSDNALAKQVFNIVKNAIRDRK